MPLYEYACGKCGKVFEVMQKMSDDTLTTHADCGGKLERLLSAPALHFKGSGFYITDYAKGSGGALPPGKADHSKHAEGSSEASKADSKADASKAATPASKGDSGSSAPAPAATSTGSDSKS